MKQINQLKWLLITLFFALPTSKNLAQTGNIQGIITDENGIYVPGANTFIESIKKGAITNFNGKFTYVAIPEGDYIVKISYLGFEDIKQDVTVTSRNTTTLNIELSSKVSALGEITIIANIDGQAKALNTQKNNINVTNVVSTDQIGKFPDANIGDALKRIPGITMQVDQGEARNIIIRGLSPQLNSVTLNGSRIPSAEGDNRNVQMDLIPSDMIQTIEVNKAVTPDMDADAIGGSVNLVTRTAPQGFRLSANVGSGINTITYKRILNGSVLVGNRSKNGKFGWMLGVSGNDTDFGSDNVEAEWSDRFEYNTGTQDSDGEDIIEELDVNPYASAYEIRTYLVQRVRRSFSANLDYQFTDNHNIYLKSMYNWRDDRENRFRLEHSILDGEDIELGDFELTNNTPTLFPVEVARKTKGGEDTNRSKNRRLEDQRMQNYTLGGNHIFGNLKVDWMTSYSKASEKRLDERYAEFETEYLINNSITDNEFPIYSPVNLEDTALDNFEFGEITNENQYTEETDINGFINFELPLDLTENGGSLKFGGRTRLKNKFRDNTFFEFTDLYESLYPTLADVPTKSYTDTNFLAGSEYAAGDFASEEWLGTLNLANFNGVDLPDEYLAENYKASEDVYAGYIMTTQNITNKFSALVGLRIEDTHIATQGFEVIEGEGTGLQINDTNSYTNILPSVHLKYNLNKNTVFRLAWTNTLARPNYIDLIPFEAIEDDEISAGNPDLEPTTSVNFDFMAEHYFKNVGIVSGGVFYKDIKDFIYTTVSEIEIDGDAFEVSKPFNGEDASILGAEFTFQRQLDFLPGFAKNFSIYANYTYLSTDTDGVRNEDGDLRDDIDLPNTAPHMFNGSLGYAGKKITARVSSNFSDAYIDEVGGESFEDRYYDQQFFLDFNASYAINKNIQLYLDVNNITNQPLRYYQSEESLTQQVEYYGQRITFGLKYDLFKKRIQK